MEEATQQAIQSTKQASSMQCLGRQIVHGCDDLAVSAALWKTSVTARQVAQRAFNSSLIETPMCFPRIYTSVFASDVARTV